MSTGDDEEPGAGDLEEKSNGDEGEENVKSHWKSNADSSSQPRRRIIPAVNMLKATHKKLKSSKPPLVPKVDTQTLAPTEQTKPVYKNSLAGGAVGLTGRVITRGQHGGDQGGQGGVRDGQSNRCIGRHGERTYRGQARGGDRSGANSSTRATAD